MYRAAWRTPCATAAVLPPELSNWKFRDCSQKRLRYLRLQLNGSVQIVWRHQHEFICFDMQLTDKDVSSADTGTTRLVLIPSVIQLRSNREVSNYDQQLMQANALIALSKVNKCLATL